MKTFLKIVLFILIWFLTMAVLMYIWLDVQGNELTKFPFYYSIISLIVPCVAVYRYKLLDKFKNIKIPKASTNKKNDTPIKIDSKTFGVIGVIILIGGLYYYANKIFVTKVIFNDDLIGRYDCDGSCPLVKWKKDSTLFTGVAQIYETDTWYEIEYYKGYKHGVEKEYEGDKLVKEKNYKYGKIGLERHWYNGQLIAEYIIKNGVDVSSYERTYYKNGQLASEVHYNDEEWERHWYENGQLKQESTYKNGEQDGLQREWNENGQLMYEANYKNGEEVSSYETYWYENGQLKSENNYKYGKQDGLQREWNENGQLMYEANFKNGEPDGLQFGTKMDN